MNVTLYSIFKLFDLTKTFLLIFIGIKKFKCLLFIYDSKSVNIIKQIILCIEKFNINIW